MRVLYHFKFSPYARRVRLALAHKGLAVELRESRDNPAFLQEARRLSPFTTVPVLVEPDGKAMGESTGITHYLDRAYPDAPAIWPFGAEDAHLAFEIAGLVDVVLEVLVSTGNRYFRLHYDPAWEAVRAETVGRAQAALDALAMRVDGLGRDTVMRAGWSGADMWLYSMIAWLRSLPARATMTKLAAQLVGLGWKLPERLERWADTHASRPDIVALDA